MTLYNAETRNSLVRLKSGELAWRELYEEFFRRTRCKCGQAYHRLLAGLKFTCHCYPHRMFDFRNVIVSHRPDSACLPPGLIAPQP